MLMPLNGTLNAFFYQQRPRPKSIQPCSNKQGGDMKNAVLLFLLFAISNGGFSNELNFFVPEQVQGDQIVKKKHYMLSYSNYHEQPEWAYYKLNKDMISGKARRLHYFQKDPAVFEKTPSMNDYKNSGYDRGHLVPAADMKLNHEAMKSTFVMSNVVPQKPEFNRVTWRILESKVRGFANEKGSIYVITGPVLERGLKKFSSQHISVPKSFYKILFRLIGGKIETITYLVPHDADDTDLTRYITSIDQIELLTGIDFLKSLPDHIENEIEAGHGRGFN
jgi:endonuclease G